MQLASRLAASLVVLLLSAGAWAAVPLEPSPHLEVIPDAPCDVSVTSLNFTTTLTRLNDPALRVFCVAAGDYRTMGELFLSASGTQQVRRILRFDAYDGYANAIQRPQRAIFESLRITGSWWVIQGLTIQPRRSSTAWIVSIVGGDRVVLEGNVIDGIDHVPTTFAQNAVVITGYDGNPARYNSVQNNLVRRGNQQRRPGDFEGILVTWGNTPTENNDYNKVLDNEVYDWGTGISVGGHTSDCSEPGQQHGTVIDGNDVYITGAKRIDCNTGAVDAAGDCACAEDGIGLKAAPGPDPGVWTRVTNNRLWGFRPTSPTFSCGGSGANGQALDAGSFCSRQVLAAKNVILDSTQGIVANSDWTVVGNLIAEVRISNGKPWSSVALFPIASASNLNMQFNTLVGVDSAYEDQSSYTDMRCNVVIGNEGLKGDAGPPNSTHFTRFNYLYDSSTQNINGSTNQITAAAQQSGNADYCFWRRRWTGPEIACIPLGSTTAASPHLAALSHCNADLAAAFGIESLHHVTSLPCADGVDNDGDGLVDFPDDPGCPAANSTTESPGCQNGLDDDGDGRIDFDGGAAANGGSPLTLRDTGCPDFQWKESATGCGLGAELVAVLGLLRAGRRRPRAPSHASTRPR